MRSVLLAKLGKAVGWRYQSIWPAAHHVHDAEKGVLWLFMAALRHYGHLVELERQDSKGRWAEKVAKWGRGVASGDAAFVEEHRYDGVVRLAFPELAPYVPEMAREYFTKDDPPPF
jgi:hypothetical protein